MNYLLTPSQLSGQVKAPLSKSAAHRVLFCDALAALSNPECYEAQTFDTDSFPEDLLATTECLRALLSAIRRKDYSSPYTFDCKESGSTLRFLLPVAAALSIPSIFIGSGKLPKRPMKELCDVLSAHGAQISFPDSGDFLPLTLSGTLTGGDYHIAGNISSQFITGLLFALPLCKEASTLTIDTPLESAPYVKMTLDTLRHYGILITAASERSYLIAGNQTYRFPHAAILPEGDYSGAAALLCMGAFSAGGITVTGLLQNSLQGDRAVLSYLKAFGAFVSCENDTVTVRQSVTDSSRFSMLHAAEIDVSDTPDLLPVLSAVAMFAQGDTTLYGAKRLRIKESDRLSSTAQILTVLGANITEREDSLTIHGNPKLLCAPASTEIRTVDAHGDHRIVMAATIAAGVSAFPVCITNAHHIQKSYPAFAKDYRSLGGILKEYYN